MFTKENMQYLMIVLILIVVAYVAAKNVDRLPFVA